MKLVSIILGSDTGTWFIDLKNGKGSVGSGDPSSGPADVTFTLKDSDFLAMFQGKLKPTNAFMTGKLKLKVGLMHTSLHQFTPVSHMKFLYFRVIWERLWPLRR